MYILIAGTVLCVLNASSWALIATNNCCARQRGVSQSLPVTIIGFLQHNDERSCTVHFAHLRSASEDMVPDCQCHPLWSPLQRRMRYDKWLSGCVFSALASASVHLVSGF